MSQLKIRKKLGKPPGSINYTGNITDQKIIIEIIKYFKDDKESIIKTIPEDEVTNLNEYLEPDTVSWINIQGVHSNELITNIGETLNFHPLLIEDVLNINQRPKIDQYKDHLVVFLRHSLNIPDTAEFENEQIVIIIGRDYVVSLAEMDLNVFQPIKDSISKHKSIYQKYSSDYLGYTLLDFIVDTYIIEADEIENRIENLEDQIFSGDLEEVIDTIFQLRRQNLYFRRIIMPLRDILLFLSKFDSEFMGDKMRLFIKDLSDHIYYVIDHVETNRDLISNLRENYNSEISNRMNQVMMTLTVISTILLPLTFLTGLYGMNFVNIPELNFKYGYFYLWVIMILISTSLLYNFRKRKWI